MCIGVRGVSKYRNDASIPVSCCIVFPPSYAANASSAALARQRSSPCDGERPKQTAAGLLRRRSGSSLRKGSIEPSCRLGRGRFFAVEQFANQLAAGREVVAHEVGLLLHAVGDVLLNGRVVFALRVDEVFDAFDFTQSREARAIRFDVLLDRFALDLEVLRDGLDVQFVHVLDEGLATFDDAHWGLLCNWCSAIERTRRYRDNFPASTLFLQCNKVLDAVTDFAPSGLRTRYCGTGR